MNFKTGAIAPALRIALAAALSLLTVGGAGFSPVAAAPPAPTVVTVHAPHKMLPRSAPAPITALPTCSPCTPVTTSPMTYHGGAAGTTGVTPAPIAYLVFWGDWSANSATQAYIRSFFNDLHGSTWLNVATQYCSGVALGASTCPGGSIPISNPALSLGGEWDDGTLPSYGANLNDTDVANALATEAQAAVPHFAGLIPANAVIMVFPSAVGPVPHGFLSEYCAFHSGWATTNGVTTTNYQDAIVPFMVGQTGCGAGVGGNVNSSYSITAGHEYAEAITDTDAQHGWFADGFGGQGENGDLCDISHVTPQTVVMNGNSYAVQALFSNAQLSSSNQCSFSYTPSSCSILPAPSAPSATAGIGSATVSWGALSTSGACGATGYRVTSSTGAITNLGIGSTSTVLSGLSSTAQSFTVAGINVAGVGASSVASNSVTPLAGGTYHPQAPQRVLDTRNGNGVPGGGVAPLGPGQSMTVQITGRGGVPASGVGSVVLNATVTSTTDSSYLTVYPAGISRPLASNLNWTPGNTVANLVELGVGSGGAVTIFNFSGSADVIFDVQGWVGDSTDSTGRAGLFNPLSPQRLLDTRDGNGRGGQVAPLGDHQTLNLQVTGRGGVPSSGVSAVVVNLTATGATNGGYLTAYPAGASTPLASNINFVAGQTRANRVMVALNSAGQISIFNFSGNTDVIVDVNGWFTDASGPASGSAFVPLPPTRFFDTRQGNPPSTLGSGSVLNLTDSADPIASRRALVLNVTVADTSDPGYVEVWPYGTSQPTASDINWAPGEVNPNLVVVASGNHGGAPAFSTYNFSGTADVIYDLVGFYGASVSVG